MKPLGQWLLACFLAVLFIAYGDAVYDYLTLGSQGHAYHGFMSGSAPRP